MNKCGRCALWQQNNQVCPIFKESFPAEQSGCPKYQEEIYKCDLCGTVLFNEYTIIPTDDEKYRFICNRCIHHINTCFTCINGIECKYETDPSPLPKVIQKVTRRGPMQTVVEVKNPERVDLICKKNCKCFSEKFGCLREINNCNCYKCILE